MERKLKKFIVLTIVLILIILVLVATVIYLKAKPYSYNLSKRKDIQMVSEENVSVLVDTEGNAYLLTDGNVDTVKDSKIKENLKNLEGKFTTYYPKGYDFYGSTSISAYKLDLSNVLSVYNVLLGNAGFKYFVFVKEDGKVSVLSYNDIIYNGFVGIADLNLNNVVSIVDNEYTQTPYAITVDGNEISLGNYIN